LFCIEKEEDMKKTVPIKKNYEFARLYRRGRFAAGKFMTIYVLENKSGINRIGLSVNRKFGKSVKRNRIKRLIRENYRLYEDRLKDGFDFVFAIRKQEIMPDFHDIAKEMKYLFKRLKVFADN
jgi:ribonuclease P protein component